MHCDDNCAANSSFRTPRHLISTVRLPFLAFLSELDALSCCQMIVVGSTVNLVCSYAGKYTIMGQVIDGNDTLDKMEKIPVGTRSLIFGLLMFVLFVWVHKPAELICWRLGFGTARNCTAVCTVFKMNTISRLAWHACIHICISTYHQRLFLECMQASLLPVWCRCS